MIDQFATAMTDRGHARSTVRRRVLTLRRFDRHLGGGDDALLQATDTEIVRWLSSLGVAPHSAAHYLGDLDRFYGWAVRWRLLEANPTTGLERAPRPTRKPRPIPTPDLAMALELADSARMKTLLTLGAFAGLRVCEMAVLHATDVDWDNGVLTVRGKGDKERIVPMHPLVIEQLDGRRRGQIIYKRGGSALHPGTITTEVGTYLRGLGINATAHNLRHWFGTETYNACRDLRVVQELLGHTDPETTAGYVAASDKRAPRGRCRPRPHLRLLNARPAPAPHPEGPGAAERPHSPRSAHVCT